MSAFGQIRYKISKSRLRVPLLWVRHRGLGPRDVFIASYPRSGSTWLRFLLFEILTNHSAGFENVNRVIPDLGRHSKALPLLPGGGRLIKTHESYRREYKRAIYLVRDARDVVVSEHAYQKAMGWISSGFDDFLPSFLQGKVNAYGAWQDHVRAWPESSLAKNGDLLLIRYEDMSHNTQSALARVLEFLGVEVGANAIQDAIAKNSVQRMRAKEEHSPQTYKSSRELSLGEEDRFVRSATVGGWRERLTDAQVEQIEHDAGAALVRLGYPTGRPLTDK